MSLTDIEANAALDSPTLTFSGGADLGANSATRQIFVAVAAYRTAAGTLTSATMLLGGNSLTNVTSQQDGTFYSGIFKLAAGVVTATNASLVITFSADANAVASSVYSVLGDTTTSFDPQTHAATDAGFSFPYGTAASYGKSAYGLIFAGASGFSADYTSVTNGTINANGSEFGLIGIIAGSNIGPLTSATTITFGKSAGTNSDDCAVAVGM